MTSLYSPPEPFARGMLDVGDGNAIAWDIAGAHDGKPAVVLHGGPGQGSSPNMRRAFDPAKYRVVLFDQRGCGHSTPQASDPATDMSVNTTHHLVADIEALRVHLGIDRWLVAGGSWGATLALAYAQRHPSRVSELVLTDVMTARRSEAEWLYGGVARFFPEAWARFRAQVEDDDVIAGYARLMEDPVLRPGAARAWCEWEDVVLSLEPKFANAFSNLPENELVAFVRICAHYVRHHAWLEEGALLRHAGRLAEIPGVLIHGRRDLSCPVETAYALSRAWPGAELVVLDDAGHLATASKRAALIHALDRFATTEPRHVRHPRSG